MHMEPRYHLFGGGTPSLLTSAQVARIIDELKMNFGIDSEGGYARIGQGTIYGKPKGYRDGVNRLSMGVQSMDDDILYGLEGFIQLVM